MVGRGLDLALGLCQVQTGKDSDYLCGFHSLGGATVRGAEG